MAGSNAYTMSMLSAMNENPDEKIQEYDMNQNRKKKVRPKLSLTADPYYEAEKAKSMNKNNTTSAYGASSQGNTGWTTHRTTDGRTYYAHEELGTTWVKPTDLYEKNAPGKRKGNEVPNFIMSPNSRNRGLRRVGSFGMGKPMPASRGTPMPPNDGTFFEHVVTFSCDWFDWSILCSCAGVFVGLIFLLIALSTLDAKSYWDSQVFIIGVGLCGGILSAWFICLGIPYIAYHTTLGRSRS